MGPAGPGGAGASFVHNQTTPAATWTITHGLGRIPFSVQLVIGGFEVFTDCQIDATHVVLTFPSSETGAAYIL